MSNNRYLEIDSTYRDRKLWPLASEFEIQISQSGRKTIENALDPVSLATPIFAWSGNCVDISHPGSYLIDGIFKLPSSPNITASSDLSTIIIYTTVPDGNNFQQLENYYTGLTFNIALLGTTTPIVTRRIINFMYLGKQNNSPGVGQFQSLDVAQITLSSPLSDSVISGNNLEYFWSIPDPSDFSDPNNPLLFVPAGRVQKNAYTNYLLYNETIREYRPILKYDEISHIIKLDTSKLGPIPNTWLTNHNFCIRKELPLVPGNTPNIVSNTTTTITSNNTSGLSAVPNFYNKNFIRILPTLYIYTNNGPIAKTLDDSLEIYNYTGIGNPGDPGDPTAIPPIPPIPPIPAWKFSMNTPLNITYTPLTFEILGFSYDNCNPFVYTGSLVSQQEMVCYEIELLNVILPNFVLAVGEGSRIAFYPYIYVELANVSASSSGNRNIIYSNNPNSTRAIFRVPIDDVINPLISTFIKVDGDGMVQTVKFKPNDNLFFRVFMATGEPYQTIIPEFYSPSLPNPAAQISASFSIRRL
jgi:hypothetical protein